MKKLKVGSKFKIPKIYKSYGKAITLRVVIADKDDYVCRNDNEKDGITYHLSQTNLDYYEKLGYLKIIEDK